MSKWQKVKIKDVCTKGTSSLSLKDLNGKEGDFSVYGAAGLVKKINFYQQENKYLAIIKDGAGVGRLYRFDGKTSVLGTMQYIFPNNNIDYSFCYYALQSIDLKKYVNGAAIPHIYFKDYSQEEIPLPPMEEQKKIAAMLDAVSDLLTKQKQFLAEQDNLIQSTFYDMFEPIHLSQKSAAWKKIGKLARVVGGSTPKTSVADYWDGSLNWFTPAELDNNSWYVYSSQRKITTAGVQSCHLEKQPADTVILSSRAPIGKLAIAKQEFYCNQGFKNIICGKKLNSVWLYHLLMYNVDYLQSLGKGATFKEISKTIVEDIKIPVPSIELQQKFAAIAEQIESEKAKIKSAIAETQTLFNALMSEYFEE